ncbi:putative secreted protein [Rhodopirellula sallentina SM41]|uniref:Putative secreted protein n=1 Tax=Rhodopirellula sallentina SM41 TaxID=1263870 RepID=M5U097_9BACT|nr:putative secreted protein [Rhodopirellula sallentina SM41]
MLQLMAVASLSGGSVMAADGTDARLVAATVQDCCPPAVTSPCYPSEYASPMIIEGTAEPAAPATESGAVTAPTPDPSFQSEAPTFDAPLTANTAANNFAAAGATSLASTTASGGGLDAPNMLGDSPGYGTTITISGPGTIYTIPNTATRRFKFTENISPIPQDRVFYSYSHFDGALTVDQAAGTSTYLDRHLFGGEKTFIDGLFSIELRLAVSDGFASDLSTALDRGGEFGNIQLAFKSLLYSGDSCLVGGGMTLTLPTADDLQFAGGMEMENETVFLAPYLGFVSTPTENTFLQGVTQIDFALGGDTITQGGAEDVFQEQHLFYTSLSAGAWLYRDDCSTLVNGVAAMTELHYTTALNDGDTTTATANIISGPGSIDLLNTTAGFVINKGLTNIRVAGSVPLDWDDRFYDSEFQVQINRRF